MDNRVRKIVVETKIHFTLVSIILWKRTFISVHFLRHREADFFFRFRSFPIH